MDIDKKEILTEDLGEIRTIAINLSSTNKKTINIAAKEFYEFVSNLNEVIDVPEIIKPAEAVFTTRKSPCGNGTATYKRHTLRVYQRRFNLKIHDINITKIADFLKGSAARAQLVLLP